MMRAILALSLALLVTSPAFAAKKAGAHKKAPTQKVVVIRKKATTVSTEKPACEALNLSDTPRVSMETPGYRMVHVEFDIPVASEKKPADEAGPMNIKFGIFWNGSGVKLDRGDYLKNVGTCSRDYITSKGRFFAGGMTWLRAGFVPEGDGNTETSYRLTAQLVLPEALVAEKPRGYTVMRTGVYVLKWDEDRGLAIMRFERQ